MRACGRARVRTLSSIVIPILFRLVLDPFRLLVQVTSFFAPILVVVAYKLFFLSIIIAVYMNL